MMQSTTTQSSDLKQSVRQFWQAQPCGTRDIDAQDRRQFFDDIERERYEWEPYIKDFAQFSRGRGKKLLEIGVGAGTDFINWVRSGAIATGVDMTQAAVDLARERVALEGFSAELQVADAENLPFADNSFDIVYSYGVLHHSPNTVRAISEAYRVLKPGGTALIMIYHVPSWSGFMLWAVHCLARLKPYKSPRWAIYHYLESPGTKAYTVKEAKKLCAQFSSVKAWSQLSHGDLLMMRPGPQYQHWLPKALWAAYPRRLIRATGNLFGLALMIEAQK